MFSFLWWSAPPTKARASHHSSFAVHPIDINFRLDGISAFHLELIPNAGTEQEFFFATFQLNSRHNGQLPISFS